MQGGWKSWWKRASWSRRLLLVQAGSYLLGELLSTILSLIDPLRWWDLLGALSFYPEWRRLLYAPWTLVSYVLPHQHALHLLLNLLLLYYMFPRVERFFGAGRLLTLYLGGALAGSLLYLLGYHLAWAWGVGMLPWGLRGCSSALLACLVALLVQPQALRWVRSSAMRWLLLGALLLLVFGGLSTNAGGALAHLGGMLFGGLYGWGYRKGWRWLAPWEKLEKQTPSSSPRPADEALRAKLRHSGYASLTDAERSRLRELDS